jgi:hypothetical protein
LEVRPWWRRPRVRLSLRALMIVVLLIGGGLGWIVHRADVQREAVAAIVQGGGSVKYDWEWSDLRILPNGALVPAPKKRVPPWRKWLIDHLGPDYFGDVKEVYVGPKDQPFQHVAACIIMSQGKGLRFSELPRQGCISRHLLVPLPALVPMPVPTLVVPGSSTVLRNSSLSHVSG